MSCHHFRFYKLFGITFKENKGKYHIRVFFPVTKQLSNNSANLKRT